MLSVKCTKSSVPGDLPPRLCKEFLAELVSPATITFKNIIERTVHSGIVGLWPEKWKIEYGTPINKITEPISEDDLRIISLTNHLSKVFEKMVIRWILGYIGHMIDRNQFGGTKGNSVTHYLI